MFPTPARRRWSMIAFFTAVRVPLSRSANTKGVNVSSSGSGPMRLLYAAQPGSSNSPTVPRRRTSRDRKERASPRAPGGTAEFVSAFVGCEAVTAREAQHGVLGAAAHFLDGVPGEGAQQPGLRDAAQHVGLLELGAHDLVALEPRPDLPDNRLDLRQLRHAAAPATRCPAARSSPGRRRARTAPRPGPPPAPPCRQARSLS